MLLDTDNQRVIIHVKDVNDEPPYFINRPLPMQAVVQLNAPPNTPIFTLQARDPDTDHSIHYFIVRDRSKYTVVVSIKLLVNIKKNTFINQTDFFYYFIITNYCVHWLFFLVLRYYIKIRNEHNEQKINKFTEINVHLTVTIFFSYVYFFSFFIKAFPLYGISINNNLMIIIKQFLRKVVKRNQNI